MKATKWATRRFSAEEKRARAIWRRAQDNRNRLQDGLMVAIHQISREEAHERLDRVFNTIEKAEARAREIFPEVEESFTVAKGTLAL